MKYFQESCRFGRYHIKEEVHSYAWDNGLSFEDMTGLLSEFESIIYGLFTSEDLLYKFFVRTPVETPRKVLLDMVVTHATRQDNIFQMTIACSNNTNQSITFFTKYAERLREHVEEKLHSQAIVTAIPLSTISSGCPFCIGKDFTQYHIGVKHGQIVLVDNPAEGYNFNFCPVCGSLLLPEVGTK